MARKWRDAGFAAHEAHRSGTYGIELAEATKWKGTDFSFDETVQWKDSGFTLKEAVCSRDDGLSAVDAELKRYDKSDDKGDEITSLDTDITVNKDGRLDVVETIAIIDRPGGAYENGYYKPLPKKANLRSLRSFEFAQTTYSSPGFHVKSIELDGTPADYSVSNGVLHLGTKNKPLQEGTHLIRISYTTDSRILDEPHHDELYFSVVEDNYKGRSIRSASVTVRLPKGADVIFTDGEAGLHQRKDFVSSIEETESGDIARFALTRPLREGMDFAVNVAFIKGYVNEGRLQKLGQLDKRAGRFLSSLAICLLGLVAAFVCHFIAWFKVGRDPKGRGTTVTEFSAPDRMDPARMRVLYRDGRVDYVSVAAELMYLAERGLIKIFEREGAYTIEKMPVDTADLPPSAKEFSAASFGERSEVILMRRKKKREVSNAAHALKTLLKKEYRKHSVSNRRYLRPGITVSLVSIGASLAIIDCNELDNGNAGIVIAFYATFLAAAFGVLFFVFMKLLRSPTDEYVRFREQIEGYVGFLARSFVGGGASVFLPPFLREHLPYAVAAGIDAHDLMIRNGETKWYQGTSGGFGCADFIKLVKKSL